MNITLSADERLLERARQYARQHNTSLNRMIRHYLEQVAGTSDIEQNAHEFARLARERAGASPSGYVFNREEAHLRD